jgi:hypothetical protein
LCLSNVLFQKLTYNNKILEKPKLLYSINKYSMKYLRKFLIATLLVLMVSLLVMPASPAVAYPATFFRIRQLKIPASLCLNDTKIAIQKAGLANISSGTIYTTGTTSNSRGLVICVTLPKAGPCPNLTKYKDGATAIFMAAGSDTDETKNLAALLDTKFGDPVLFDCSP